jgi:hypothetical protein
MSEGDSGPSDTDSGGGSFWTSLPALLTASAVLIGAIVSAVVTLTKDDDGDAAAATTSQTSTGTTGDRFFRELTRPLGRVYFEGETMLVKASQPGRPLLVLAESDEAIADVRLGAHVEWVSGAKDYGVGFVCRYADAGNYYLLSVLSGGRYHIVRYRRGKPVSLTGGIQTSGAVDDTANDVFARCVGTDPVTLTLTVGGQQVATVRDADGIDGGNVGIRVGTSESVVTTSFRRFELRSLE